MSVACDPRVVRGSALLSRALLCAAVVVGIAGVADLIDWPGAICVLLSAATTGWTVAAVRALADHRRPRRLLASGLLPASLLTGAVGLAHLFGPCGLLVAAALVTADPSLRRCARALRATVGRRPSSAGPAVDDTGAAAPPPDGERLDDEIRDLTVPDALSDADLCAAWRSSYVALHRARTLDARLRTVEIRALYLDVLERRLGEDFARWMSSGPRPAGAPEEYLSGSNDEQA